MINPNNITKTNGIIDLYISIRVISFGAIARIKNKLYPKGGVIYAIWQVIVYKTPYQIGSNPKAIIKGTYNGATITNIAVSSRNIPIKM